MDSPGYLVKQALTAKGWEQRTLAIVCGWSESKVSRLLTDQETMTAAQALVLAEVLPDLSPEQLLSAQGKLELARARLRFTGNHDVAQRAGQAAIGVTCWPKPRPIEEYTGNDPVLGLCKSRGWLTVRPDRSKASNCIIGWITCGPYTAYVIPTYFLPLPPEVK